MTYRLIVCLALAFLVCTGAHAQKGGGLRAFGLSETELDSIQPRSPDPLLAYLAVGVEPDLEYWTAKLAIEGARRARLRSARGFRSAPTATYRERERAVFNRNDDAPESIPVDVFGDAEDEPIAQINGTYETRPPSESVRQTPTGEDAAGGAITPTRIRLSGAIREGATTVTARIGDGPFGSTTGDVDVYELIVPDVGTYALIEPQTPTGDLDPVMALYGPDGAFLVAEDDDRDQNDNVISQDPKVYYFFETPGTYRLYVWGFRSGAQPPGLRTRTDASSGYGAGSTGPYELFVASMTPDTDTYSVDLDLGDVLGVASANTTSDLAIFAPDGTLLMRSRFDLSGSYPDGGLLLSPGELGATNGGVTVAAVAPEAGTYVIEARGQGPYSLVLQKGRPGHERAGANAVETIFVDFDGGTYYPQRDLGERTRDTTYLSPLRDFLPRWGLTPSDESAVVDAFMRTLQHTLRDALRTDVPGMAGLNVVFLNSRDHPDPGPGVNRLVIAGTAEQIGQRGFIGKASSVDIGNYRQDDIGYVLLDLRSAAPDNPNSINQFGVAAPRTKAELVGHSMGTVAAHEAGHFFGLHHTENDNSVRNVQDAGPGALWHVLDIGSDGVFGLGDGDDVRFRSDEHYRFHPFTGTLRAADALAHSLHTAERVSLGPSSGGASAVLRENGFSAAAQQAASARAHGRLLARETFASDPEGRWAYEYASGTRSRVLGGVARLTASAGKNLTIEGHQTQWRSGEDIAMRVDLRHAGGCDANGAGLLFHVREGSGFNIALVDIEGDGYTRMRRRTSGWEDVAPWVSTSLTRSGEWNTLELVVVGGHARLILNGALVREARFPSISGRDLVGGLSINGCATSSMTADFDNLTVVELGATPFAGGPGLRSFGNGTTSAEEVAGSGGDTPGAEAPMQDGPEGEVGVRGVSGGAPAARGFVYSFGGTRVRLTEGDGQPRLWILTPGAEVWREARAGEVAALLGGEKPPAVASETALSGEEAAAALARLRAMTDAD